MSCFLIKKLFYESMEVLYSKEFTEEGIKNDITEEKWYTIFY